MTPSTQTSIQNAIKRLEQKITEQDLALADLEQKVAELEAEKAPPVKKKAAKEMGGRIVMAPVDSPVKK